VFQPFKDGKPFGNWEVFADGFAGSPEKAAMGRAERKPCGLAQGPDGSLYITDDVKGAIFKVSYDANAAETTVAENKKVQPASKIAATGSKSATSKASSDCKQTRCSWQGCLHAKLRSLPPGRWGRRSKLKSAINQNKLCFRFAAKANQCDSKRTIPTTSRRGNV
jgi:hypothetical protein